jgi:2-C-methyl-D-erythritol 4-phosphate cytidylyltransferase
MAASPIPKSAAIIVGGGSGSRFGGDKLAVPVADKPLIAWTLRAFQETSAISSIVLVVPVGREEELRAIAEAEGIAKLSTILPGGGCRHESVIRGLEALPVDVALAAIHDAARPMITPALITRCLEVAAAEGASSLAAPVTDTLHETDAAGCAARTIDRSSLHAMQTPQVFQAGAIRELLHKDSGKPTDEVSVALAAGWCIPFVENLEPNPKVTWPHDLVVVQSLLRARQGHGISK